MRQKYIVLGFWQKQKKNKKNYKVKRKEIKILEMKCSVTTKNKNQ